MSNRYKDLGQACTNTQTMLKWNGVEVDAGHWQGVTTEGRPDLLTRELLNVRWSAPMPRNQYHAEAIIEPNMPWAETEHAERVASVPHNPHHSMDQWPWWHDQIPREMTHTYSERLWPTQVSADEDGVMGERRRSGTWRYSAGNLSDVVELLNREPHTRQAYVPIFFPEDTGAVHEGRIPCTLGYHLMLRDEKLHMWYDIRSCDAVRHFRDDVYLAVRLCQWFIAELIEIELRDTLPQVWVDVVPGDLHFSAHSLHFHMGDAHHMP